MKIFYEKNMMNYNSNNHSWQEINNTEIVKLLKQLRDDLYSNYQGMIFHFKVKPDETYSRVGKIIIKTNLDKTTLLIKLGERFNGKLNLKWK